MPEPPAASGPLSAGPVSTAAERVGAWIELDLGPPPDAAEIVRIVGRADPVLRNLEITIGYYRLSYALRRRLGHDNANWCTFGVWASRRAGRTIRGDDLGTLREHLRRRLERDHAFAAALDRLNARLRRRGLPVVVDKRQAAARVLAVVDDVGAFLADGNAIVFGEMAPPFAELIARFGDAARLDEGELRRFLDRFVPGPIEGGGQDLLRAAFEGYARALFEPDPKAQAELILLSSDRIGLHEQTRIQPQILAALTAPIEHLGEWLAEDIRAKLPLTGRLLQRARIDPLAPFLVVVDRIWREVVTQHLMTLPMPGEVLGLGRDIGPPPGRSTFPPLLQEISNADLVAFLRQHDRTPNTTVGSGALDWSVLADRVHYILDLFRSRQQQPTLYQAPFVPEQCRAILEGRVPAGQL